MEKVILTDRVRNGVLYRVKDGSNTILTIKWRKTNWICHTLCRNSFIKHVIHGNIEGTGGRGRRPKQLLYDLTEI
jgi:hypothetical protein